MNVTVWLLCLLIALCASCASRHTDDAAMRLKLSNAQAAAFNAEDYGEAQMLAEELTRVDPECADYWVVYGMASARLEEFDRARRGYESALALYRARDRQERTDANLKAQEIYVLFLLGRSSEAEELLDQVRREYPDDQQLSRMSEHLEELKQDRWGNLAVDLR